MKYKIGDVFKWIYRIEEHVDNRKLTIVSVEEHGYKFDKDPSYFSDRNLEDTRFWKLIKRKRSLRL